MTLVQLKIGGEQFSAEVVPMIRVGVEDRVFILSGAGGLWRSYRIEEVASPYAWARDPVLVWEFYSMRRRVAAAARPNPAHAALAQLERKLEDRMFLCTQNVDNLHEQAGSRRVLHMHGELFKSRCDTCPRPPFADESRYEPPASILRCECGGQIRPHICWFGEVPFEMDRIFAALDRCTIFIAVGTSGVVEPAASFVAHVQGRARTYYVGPELPANASSFDQCFQGNAGKILPALFTVECAKIS